MLLHVLLLHLIARLAGEDDQFANHILAAEVDAGIRLAIALLLGQAHRLRERNLLRDGVEDEVQRTREHCLDAQDLVAGVQQVVDGTDDGQSSAYVGLEEELHAAFHGRLLQAGVVLIGR